MSDIPKTKNACRETSKGLDSLVASIPSYPPFPRERPSATSSTTRRSFRCAIDDIDISRRPVSRSRERSRSNWLTNATLGGKGHRRRRRRRRCRQLRCRRCRRPSLYALSKFHSVRERSENAENEVLLASVSFLPQSYLMALRPACIVFPAHLDNRSNIGVHEVPIRAH